MGLTSPGGSISVTDNTLVIFCSFSFLRLGSAPVLVTTALLGDPLNPLGLVGNLVWLRNMRVLTSPRPCRSGIFGGLRIAPEPQN